MPGMWIKRDPETREILEELDKREMSELIRSHNPDSPDYLAFVPDGGLRFHRSDNHTVDVREVGSDEPRLPFRWEFDLYDGWAEQGRTEPPPVVLADAAWWEGASILDFIAAPGSVTAAARRAVEVERRQVFEVAEPLVSALRAMNRNPHDVYPGVYRWYTERAATVNGLAVEVLARLTRGDERRARALLDQAYASNLADALAALREQWNTEDYAARFGNAAEPA